MGLRWTACKRDDHSSISLVAAESLCLQYSSQICIKAKNARCSRLPQDQLFDNEALCVLVGWQGCDTWAVFEAMFLQHLFPFFCLAQMFLICCSTTLRSHYTENTVKFPANASRQHHSKMTGWSWAKDPSCTTIPGPVFCLTFQSKTSPQGSKF